MTVTQAHTTNGSPKRKIDYIKKDFSVQEELMCVFDPWHYQAIRKIVRFEAPYHLLEGDRKIPDEVTVFVTLEEWDGTMEYHAYTGAIYEADDSIAAHHFSTIKEAAGALTVIEPGNETDSPKVSFA